MEKKEIDIQLKKLDDEFHVSNLQQLMTTVDGSIESNLTAWDYLWSIAFGFAGIFISNNEKLDAFLQSVHDSASGSDEDCTPFQKFLGAIFRHKNDSLDKVGKKFINRNGDHADAAFHRVFWGHDILSFGKDNPFYLLVKQYGWFGIIQAIRHLSADTMSKQGLPLPGSSWFDYTDSESKTKNYLVDLSRKLSLDSFGSKNSSQEIYRHLLSIRGQHIISGLIISTLSNVYFRITNIDNEFRIRQFLIMAYSVNFFGDYIYGYIKTKTIPYINYPVGQLLLKNLIQLDYMNKRETNKLINEVDEMEKECLKSKKEIQEMDLLVPKNHKL